MLNDVHVSQFKKVYLAPGFTDLRRGIDGLAAIVRFQFSLDPYDKNTLFLFCDRRSDRIKALLWEGDGFLLLYQNSECMSGAVKRDLLLNAHLFSYPFKGCIHIRLGRKVKYKIIIAFGWHP